MKEILVAIPQGSRLFMICICDSFLTTHIEDMGSYVDDAFPIDGKKLSSSRNHWKTNIVFIGVWKMHDSERLLEIKIDWK